MNGTTGHMEPPESCVSSQRRRRQGESSYSRMGQAMSVMTLIAVRWSLMERPRVTCAAVSAFALPSPTSSKYITKATHWSSVSGSTFPPLKSHTRPESSLFAEFPHAKRTDGGSHFGTADDEHQHRELFPHGAKRSQPHNNNRPRQKASRSSALMASSEGLSKFHRSILSSATRQQRFVTGNYPLLVSVRENPTRKWLSSSLSLLNNEFFPSAASQLLVNGTCADRSLASYDRFQWLDDNERNQEQEGTYACMSFELIAEIHVKKPGYVNLLPGIGAGMLAARTRRDPLLAIAAIQTQGSKKRKGHSIEFESVSSMPIESPSSVLSRNNTAERLWITGFSITKQSGELHYLDIDTGHMGQVNSRTANAIRWPNEVNSVPVQRHSVQKRNPIYHSTRRPTTQNGWMGQSNSIRTCSSDILGVSSHSEELEDALLVSDGFLVPGRDNGGLYVILNPGHEQLEWKVCLAGGNGVDGGLFTKLFTRRAIKTENEEADGEGWFYHRSIWIDLTGDGRQSILTARAKRPSILKNIHIPKGTTVPKNDEQTTRGTVRNRDRSDAMNARAQLVWIERPKPCRYDELTGTPLDVDGTVFDPFSPQNTPWRVRVLDEGPDVMFSVADLDITDDTVEVIASQFFNQTLTLHSVQRGPEPRVVFRRTLDDRCGASFSSILADLDGNRPIGAATRGTRNTVIDSGSTVTTLRAGDSFSHVLVTSHKCKFANEEQKCGNGGRTIPPILKFKDDETKDMAYANSASMDSEYNALIQSNMVSPIAADVSSQSSMIDGGSLFAYRVPLGNKNEWKTEPWLRSLIATGFRVRGQLDNVINPGAPGFCYTFYPTKDGGKKDGTSRPLIGIAGDCAEAAYILRPVVTNNKSQIHPDPSTDYVLMCEIECGATVGSLGIGYNDFCSKKKQSGYAKLYVPCYEKDKVLVFAMGDGEEEDDDDGIDSNDNSRQYT